jgi:hypothetical protein
VTQNISSEGFYSVVEEFIPVGDSVECLLLIPGGHADGLSDGLWLRCSARVVHVNHVAGGSFGIGMRILEYSLTPKLDQNLEPDPAQEPGIIVRNEPSW